MPPIIDILWLIPVLPLVAAVIAFALPKSQAKWSPILAIGSIGIATLLSLDAFVTTLGKTSFREFQNVPWFEVGWDQSVYIGWLLDPLTAAMLVMVTFVSTLIFIFSLGYMAGDERKAKFFSYLSFFAAAMLGIVISNSLLLLFICWELVGLASYLLIGFWYHKPSAAAAAQKAFVVTRLADVGFFIGIIWLYVQGGTLLLYGSENLGVLDVAAAFTHGTYLTAPTFFGLPLAGAVTLLIFMGAMGKSGQFPFHVWLPDAMEGPTPVSALIHAATMVAAGVFLMARIQPLIVAAGGATSFTACVITTVGAITALLGALLALGQMDIKRVLAYSTVSQLGFMMMTLGVGGWVAAIFHLLTHGFFKALLFLGAGSVIHGNHHEQDIRHLGGLRGKMKVTFATFAVGMMSLAGFPFLFCGFWSKEAIFHATSDWDVSQWPFRIAVISAFFTAFYMTRLMIYVFFGANRGHHEEEHPVHESPAVMTVPLLILATVTVLLSVVCTPAWPWLETYLSGPLDHPKTLAEGSGLILLSLFIVALGVGVSWWMYAGTTETLAKADPLEEVLGKTFGWLQKRFFFDELYDLIFVRSLYLFATISKLLDRWAWGLAVSAVGALSIGFAWVGRFMDEFVVRGAFDEGCLGFMATGKVLATIQSGSITRYLRILAVAVAVLAVIFFLRGLS